LCAVAAILAFAVLKPLDRSRIAHEAIEAEDVSEPALANEAREHEEELAGVR